MLLARKHQWLKAFLVVLFCFFLGGPYYIKEKAFKGDDCFVFLGLATVVLVPNGSGKSESLWSVVLEGVTNKENPKVPKRLQTDSESPNLTTSKVNHFQATRPEEELLKGGPGKQQKHRLQKDQQDPIKPGKTMRKP